MEMNLENASHLLLDQGIYLRSWQQVGHDTKDLTSFRIITSCPIIPISKFVESLLASGSVYLTTTWPRLYNTLGPRLFDGFGNWPSLSSNGIWPVRRQCYLNPLTRFHGEHGAVWVTVVIFCLSNLDLTKHIGFNAAPIKLFLNRLIKVYCV